MVSDILNLFGNVICLEGSARERRKDTHYMLTFDVLLLCLIYAEHSALL